MTRPLSLTSAGKVIRPVRRPGRFDRRTAAKLHLRMLSARGGMNIEAVAEEFPEASTASTSTPWRRCPRSTPRRPSSRREWAGARRPRLRRCW